MEVTIPGKLASSNCRIGFGMLLPVTVTPLSFLYASTSSYKCELVRSLILSQTYQKRYKLYYYYLSETLAFKTSSTNSQRSVQNPDAWLID